MGSVGNSTSNNNSTTNSEVVAFLRTEADGTKWLDYAKTDEDGRSTLVKDLRGYLGYNLFNKTLIPFKNPKGKAGVEYGIAGERLYFSRYGGQEGGYSGYKIENGTLYVSRWSPTTKAEANKWAREDVNNDNAWTPLGKIRRQ